MRAGTLDIRIALQRKTISYSSSGVPVETWATLVQRWASINPLTGDERNAAQQWIAREQTQFTLRWSSEIADLSPLDQLIYPASDAANSPVPSRSTFDIISVHEVGRNDKIVINAARRVG
jgi:head-tail adaptor